MTKYELTFTLFLKDYEAEIFCFFLDAGFIVSKTWIIPHSMATLLCLSISSKGEKEISRNDVVNLVKTISNQRVKYYSCSVRPLDGGPPHTSGPNFDFSDSNKELIEKVSELKMFF